MKFVGSGFLLTYLSVPIIMCLIFIFVIALIFILLAIILPFTLTRHKSAIKDMKENLNAEEQKILNQIQEEKRCLSVEERQLYVKRIREIVRNGRKQAINAMEEEMGIENMKKGTKIMMDDFTKKDIKDLFK